MWLLDRLQRQLPSIGALSWLPACRGPELPGHHHHCMGVLLILSQHSSNTWPVMLVKHFLPWTTVGEWSSLSYPVFQVKLLMVGCGQCVCIAPCCSACSESGSIPHACHHTGQAHCANLLHGESCSRCTWAGAEKLQGPFIIHGILQVQPACPGGVQRLLSCTQCSLLGVLHLCCTGFAASNLQRTTAHHESGRSCCRHC